MPGDEQEQIREEEVRQPGKRPRKVNFTRLLGSRYPARLGWETQMARFPGEKRAI